MTWYEELKQMREKAGLTLEEAAKQLMCSVNALKDYEAGERMPRDEMIGRIWRFYKGW